MLNGTRQVCAGESVRDGTRKRRFIARDPTGVQIAVSSVFGGEKNGMMKVARRAPELTTHHVFFADL